MFPLVFFLFIAMPIIEIWVLIEVGSRIGVLQTVGLVILTAVIGTALLRAQGLATWSRLQGKLAQGELPATEMFEGVALMVGGALLLTPGFVTDGIGFLCLLPPTRKAIIAWMLSRAQVRVAGMHHHSEVHGGVYRHEHHERTDVIEGEYRRED